MATRSDLAIWNEEATHRAARAADERMAAIAGTRVKRVRDADGAYCLDCKAIYTVETHMHLPLQWTWRKSQWMHETGTLKHHMVMFAYERASA